MLNQTNCFLLHNSGLLFFLLNSPKKSLINMMLCNKNITKNLEYSKNNRSNNLKNELFDNNINIKRVNTLNINKKPERLLKQISFVSKNNKENLLYNNALNNKIIFVEGIKAWEKYGVLKNNYSNILFDEMMKININDNLFSSQEESNKILVNILKLKIKKINEKENSIGSAVFCGLYFNKELNKMISVSVGNILYSILRENSRHEYEIIYFSTGQYHDINIPYQLSSLNQDYNHLDIKYHNVNINDIIIISDNKQIMLSFINKINTKKDNLYKLDEMNNDNYLANYKIMNGKINLVNKDDMSMSSTASSY